VKREKARGGERSRRIGMRRRKKGEDGRIDERRRGWGSATIA
jgi:hypothetical protein